MNIEEYLKKFRFEKISLETKGRIWQRIERKIESIEKEKISLIDKLWNWKYATSVAAIILLFSIFNLHLQRYSEKMMPVASYEERMLDPDTKELFAFLDENPKPSLLSYLKYTRAKKEDGNFKNYILRIEELIG